MIYEPVDTRSREQKIKDHLNGIIPPDKNVPRIKFTKYRLPKLRCAFPDVDLRRILTDNSMKGNTWTHLPD